MNRILQTVFTCCFIFLGAGLAAAQAPVANFSGTPLSNCSPIVVQFTDQSTGSPTSWSWNLGNGTTSTVQNPSTTYSVPGNYTITLVATNASGSSTKIITNYVVILPAPTVDFAASDTLPGCNTKTVTFNNLSVLNTSGAGSYYWDFGDGNYSLAASPTHVYSTIGNFNVTLVVTNSNGCTKILTRNAYIHVITKPVSNFTASNNNSCTAPLSTSFTNTSTGGITYAWNFGDGGTSTVASPTHSYAASGSYTVTLITTGIGGCSDTMVRPAFVNIGNLTAGFTQSTTSTCTGNNISFTNTTTPGGSGSTWNFGDGTTSTLLSPTHAYTTAGTYTVKLVVNYNNCADSATRTITVLAGPTSAFTGSPLVGCAAPLSTTFTNSSSGAASYLWLFGDGGTITSTAPSHTYNANGVYTVKLISTSANGCTDTLTRPNYIFIVPTSVTIGGTTLLGCAPAAGSFTANVYSVVPITTYTWNFGDGNTGTGLSVTHTYSATGTYTLTLTVSGSGCTATTTTTVVVGAHPVAAFTATPDTVCVNAPVTFSNTSTGATTYLWLFGGGGTSTATAPVYNYPVPGVYTVKLIASNNGCTDTLTRTNYITVQNPLANFTFTYPCNNRKQLTFTNTSIGATSYSWDFGDGSAITTTTSPTHTYTANGTYTVSLTATSSITHCTTIYSKVISIYDLTPAFSATSTVFCAPGSTYFIGNLHLPATFTWDYGDAQTQTYFSPDGVIGVTHNYYPAGVFTVKVVVTDTNSCKDSLTRVNYIHSNKPTVAFTNSPFGGCGARSIIFTDSSAASSGSTISNRQWIFGDGTILNTTATTVTHTYSAAGNFTVKLIITETGGCTDSLTKSNLILINKPTALFSTTDTLACRNGLISFVNGTTGTAALSYNWTFGDGGTSTSNATSLGHAYSTPGYYNVQLIATDGNGCKDTLTRPNYIHVVGLTAGFTMSDSFGYCPPFTVSFTNTSANAVSYVWIFGNGNISTLANTTTTYTSAGTYTVRLIATNAVGCHDTAIRTVIVNAGPSGTLSYTPSTGGCGPLSISFNTTSAFTNSITYDFDNGVTQTTSNASITYTYAQPGIFIPKVIFSNSNGCNTYLRGTDTIRVVKVYAGFRATPNAVCIGGSIQFLDTSRAVAANLTTWTWSFGDGGTSGAINPVHTYTTAGTYTVRLIAGTTIGCPDTTYRTVVINPKPVITVASQVICNGSSVTLPATGTSSTYAWSPATGLSCTNCASPVASPAATTTYTIVGTTSFGCKDSVNATVTVNPIPVISAGSTSPVCAGAPVTLTVSGAAAYVWSPATNLSCTTCASPTATPTATTTYKVVGTSGAGCKDSANVTVTVNPLPGTTILGGNQFICPGGSVTLNTGGTAATYAWSPATGLSCTNCASPVASPAATTTYKVVGTSTAGCKDSATVTVTVNGTPVVTVSGTRTVCAGGNTMLTATGANSYAWSPATGLSCTNCASPTITPTATTTYTVTGSSGVGCTGTTTVTVTVNPLPLVYAGLDVAICNGASTPLTASGASTYVWSPATGLSCTACMSTTASPVTTTSYVVVGTDANSCMNRDTVIVNVNPKPVVTSGGNKSICPGDSVMLNGGGAATYVWSPATGLSCTACAGPKASPAITTTYKVVGTSAAGCKDSTTAVVTVNPVPVVTISGTTPICTGLSSTLTAGGASTYVWNAAPSLSCTACTSTVATPTVTTTYTVTGTSALGCTGTANYTVTVNPLPNVNAGIDTAFCAGGSVGLNVTGAASYVWSPAAGLSCTGCSSPIASPAVTTNYIVTGTSAAGCVKTDTVLVTVKTLPTISAGLSTSICPGGSATLNASGGISYVWTPGATLSCTTCASPVATPAATTTYTVTGTGANGCLNTGSVTVSVNSTPSVAITGTPAICIGGSTTLTATGAASFTWSPSTGLSATSGTSVTASPTATTTYTVTGTSGIGCTGTATFTVTVNPLPTVSAGSNVPVCAGNSIMLTATGASMYAWSPSGTLSAATGTSVTATPSATTTYTVTGTNSNGCVNTANVTVTVNPLPVVSAGSPVSICPGNATTLTATGAATYVWSPSTGLSCTACASPSASPATTTTYTVTGTSAANCSSTATVTVTVNPLPSVNISGATAICAGGNTMLTATGAAAYSWSPATGLSCTTCAMPYASPATTTTYTITGTSGANCSATTTFTLTVNPLPVVNAGADTAICSGSAVVLSATGAATYAWSPAAGLSCTACASPTASPTATTNYIVTGTSTFGCTRTDTVLVTVKPLPVISAGAPAAVCPGGSATLNASGGISYVWTPGATLSCTTCASPAATPAATTTYIVTGTGANGCTNTSSVTVTVNPKPVVTITGNTSVCAGLTTTLTAGGALNYVWSPSTGLSCTTCISPTVTPTATLTYKVTGTNGTGCSDSAFITVVLHPLPVVTTDSAAKTACLHSPVQLLAAGASGYSWTPAAGLSCSNCAAPVATPATTTTYIVTGTDAFGCMGTAQTIVNVLPLPAVDAGQDVTICKGTSTMLNASGAATYVWSPATGLSCTTCIKPVATPQVTTTYVLTGTGANGCTATATVTVNLYTQPPVNAGPDQTICAGKTAQLQASGAQSYIWTPAANLDCTTCANPKATPMATVTYGVVGTDVHGCIDSDQVKITVIQHNPVSIGQGGDFCAGGSIQLHAEGGDSYTWSPAGGLSCVNCPEPIATPSSTTIYSVVIRQGQCFTDTLSDTVTIHPIPTVNAGPDQSIILGSTVQINATGTDIETYSWSPAEGLSCTSCARPVAAPLMDRTYVVTVTSPFGCTAQDSININVRCDGVQVWMPNTFTPNADGENDFLYPHGKGITEVTRLRIYDRWGEVLYERSNMPVNDKSYGWDGTYKSQALKPDVYVWIINATCTNGEKLELKGDVSLIR